MIDVGDGRAVRQCGNGERPGMPHVQAGRERHHPDVHVRPVTDVNKVLKLSLHDPGVTVPQYSLADDGGKDDRGRSVEDGRLPPDPCLNRFLDLIRGVGPCGRHRSRVLIRLEQARNHGRFKPSQDD
ncbi:hypothetical protein AAH979_20315 [Plantactinospora sp. ZYX-F-223]|uniref:hypothetical protein n=1 Tax=Plantactinospora sp. ZYX-F-223 TaxID=3144103 RepID=UPI0031FC78F1